MAVNCVDVRWLLLVCHSDRPYPLPFRPLGHSCPPDKLIHESGLVIVLSSLVGQNADFSANPVFAVLNICAAVHMIVRTQQSCVVVPRHLQRFENVIRPCWTTAQPPENAPRSRFPEASILARLFCQHFCNGDIRAAVGQKFGERSVGVVECCSQLTAEEVVHLPLQT